MVEKNKSAQMNYNEKTEAELAGSVGEAGFFIRALQRAALDCVSKGDINAVSRVIKAYVFVGANSEVVIPLRSRKNRFIALCALASERAVNAGLEDNSVNELWERYSKLCDDSQTAEKVNALTIKLLLELTAKVHQHAERVLTVSAEKVKKYVADHLRERITVGEVAKNLGLNASYLNSSFKRQTGKCITDYIQSEKTEAAKKLLADDNCSIADIWTELGYYDQSHFSKIFKKHTGLTPKQFKTSSGSSCANTKDL